MSWIRRAWNAVAGHDVNPDIDEELQFHIDQRTRDNIADGMSSEAARRDAVQRFGSRSGVRERTRDADVLGALESVVQDLAYAVRVLLRRPALSIVGVLTLALGIGATTAIVGVVYQVLLRPLPFPDPDRLIVVSYQPADSTFWLYPGLLDADYLAMQEATLPFAGTASFASSPVTLTGAGETTRLTAATVTPDFFRVLRITPALGRTFTAGDIEPGRDRGVLLGDGVWRSRFGADAGIVGQRIVLDGVPHAVVGVLPPGFSYPLGAEVWIPLAIRVDPRMSYSRPVIARLAGNTTREQAQAAWETFTGLLSNDGARSAWRAQVIPLKDAVVQKARRPLLMFAGAVALVLLIACANVSNLILLRTSSRAPEIATRLALGAGRARVIRQLITESFVLAVAGGLAGALVTLVAVPSLLAWMPPGLLPRDDEIRMNGTVPAISFGLVLLCGVLVGVIPAFQGTRAGVSGALRDGTGWTTRRSDRFRHGLVIAEVALALVLMVGAGLLLKSFLRLTSVDLGFQPAQVMTMTIDVPDATYPTLPLVHAFRDRLLGVLRTVPDVVHAGAINWVPLGDMHLGGDVQLWERESLPDYRVTKSGISPGYLPAMGIRILRGRDFTDADTATAAGVAIVSESAARRLWPGEDALGRQLTVVSRPTAADWLTVVGVVSEVRQGGLRDTLAPAVYQTLPQVTRPPFLRRITFVARTAGEPQQVAPAMRAALARIDPQLAPQTMGSMETLIATSVAEPRFQTRLFVLFSALALLLAAIGVYGVLAASVSERRREIGIRMALGAERATLMRMVLGRVLLLTSCGVVLGTAAAWGLSRLLRQLLFEITPTDATAFVGAAVLLAVVAGLAGLIPARKASLVDPIGVLRAE